MILEDLLIKHEGVRNRPYKDSLGNLTIGVGHNLDKPLSTQAIIQILEDDISDARKDAKTFSWFQGLNETRQNVILDMIFNMGLERFKGFKLMNDALMKSDYSTAADEMLNSLWAKEVGLRASELSQLMRTGVDNESA